MILVLERPIWAGLLLAPATSGSHLALLRLFGALVLEALCRCRFQAHLFDAPLQVWLSWPCLPVWWRLACWPIIYSWHEA